MSWIMGKKTKRTSAKLHVMLENNQDFLYVDAKGLIWYYTAIKTKSTTTEDARRYTGL